MRLALKLAYRNLIGAGLRTWLNVTVLSFSFVIIIFVQAIMTGWDHQARTDMINWEIGGGQYWHENYDPFDPFTFENSHAPIPEELKGAIENGNIEAFLIVSGSIYPQGRMQSVTIIGINPEQNILLLPSNKLDTIIDAIPALIGSSAARNFNLNLNERSIIRWRDSKGMFDASEIIICGIFSCNVPGVDAGKIYIPFKKLQSMMGLENEASIFTFRDNNMQHPVISGWILKTKDQLTKAIDDMIKTKTVGQAVLYLVLLMLAMLAIFDTQVLSIFRRQKEIGTYIALGYTRAEVTALFTLEGAMHAILAALLSALYGLPLLAWVGKTGWTMPVDVSEYGIAIAQTLYPVYSAGLIISTMMIILIITIIVSYIPSGKIGKMSPTQALKGKIQ